MAELPATMPAAVFQGIRDVTVEDLAVPTLGATDVLLEVSHCGICGSDLHFVVHWPGAGKPGSVEGHEFSGVVVAVGDAVTDWRPGDAVVGGADCAAAAASSWPIGQPRRVMHATRPRRSTSDAWLGWARRLRTRAI